MDTIFPPLTIFVGNLVVSVVMSIVRDVINSVFFGKTELVVQKLNTNRNPARAETPHVEISGRRAGLIGYLLTLFDLSPTITFTANSKEVRKTMKSLHGESLDLIPLSHDVCVQSESQRSLVWLLAAVLSFTVGVGSGLLLGEGMIGKILMAGAWVLAGAWYLFSFYNSHVFEITAQGSVRTGVSFGPSIIEGQPVRFEAVKNAAEILMERILVASERTVGMAGPQPVHTPMPTSYEPGPAANVPWDNPMAPAAPAFQPPASPAQQAPYANASAEETLAQPPAAQQPPEPSNTGTVEYGDDEPPLAASNTGTSGWQANVEPGTSDSIQLRQSVTRSETGMFLNMANMSPEFGDLEDMDDDDLDDDAGAVPHRGTVSWEEQADKTQDEMRAEEELKDLKNSRPKRGEAKLRLRELMRRFPQTEAAGKARRMLEKLESGQ